MSKENERSEEFKRFDAAVSHIMSIPKSEVDKRMAAYKKKRAKQKRTKKSASPASDAQA
jgi:hypothetical protein